MTFATLNMNQRVLDAINKSGYKTATDIQAQAIPPIMENKDVLASAQTGTGKTAAFALPIINRIHNTKKDNTKRVPRSLILAPTRELALQIQESFTLYGRFTSVKTAAIYGGVPKFRQIKTIKRGVDVIIATPGRLLDLINMKIFKLDTIEHYVLDEADRMLDMGFIHDVKLITSMISAPHQTMLFSATMPKSIQKLSKELMQQPVRIEIAKDNTPLETIKQSIYYIQKQDKPALLSDILETDDVRSAIVFVRTKQGANRLSTNLNNSGIMAQAIHGNKTQSQRHQTLQDFKQKKVRVLVATDVASRGIDIDDLSHVINYDIPESPETYLHRIGRTARAGRHGFSLSFCSPEETHLVKSVQSHINMIIPVESDHRFKEVKKVNNKPSNHKKKSAQKSAHSKKQHKPKVYAYAKRKNKSNKKYARAYAN